MLELLEMLKIDRSISTTAYDERLLQYLERAQAEITLEGYTFQGTLTVKEMSIIVALAGFYWDNRTYGNMNQTMPRSIRYELNNMILAQKMKEENG